MKVALPTYDKKLCMHFGHCEAFAVVDFDEEAKVILEVNMEIPPLHEPGVLPKWLNEKGVNLIIAGGIGNRAQQLFKNAGIDVVFGVSADESIMEIVKQYFDNTLESGTNVCDH